ncbi:hypothetical protein BGY98DRAFT_1017490 [Russula aff. rugulosa BPL654]|nr:hypothetical protein BGY98DRAFT_1017490 [Russula aff. rugulosa BPL654]
MTSSFTSITSHKPLDGGSRNVSRLTSKAPKPDVTPSPVKMQSPKPAQRPGWQGWFQNIWTSGK